MSKRGRGRFFSNISETIRRESTRKPKNPPKAGENDDGKFRNRIGSHLEQAEQQRIMIGNLVKEGRLSVEDAMSFAEVTGLTVNNKEQEENMTYNFGVYKHTKDRSRTERYILQFDFNEQALSTIQKGKFGKKIPFHEIRDYDSEDGVRFYLYLDDGEIEYDADSAEEKNKMCSLLDGIVHDNKGSQYPGSDYSGLSSLPRRSGSISSKQVIKEGQIEKRGHSAAFLTWSKRYLKISEGELAYYKIGEENMTALNIIKLGPGHAFIKKLEHNCFIISTQKKEYSFRIVNANNSKDIDLVRQERDEWFTALSEAVQPSSPVSVESPQSKSPTNKQDVLNTVLEQEEYLRQTVESLQKELEQLMSVMTVVDAPIQATKQMKKVQEIVKTLDTQIKTGLLAWTMKSVVTMNCSISGSPGNDSSFNKSGGINSLGPIPENVGQNNTGGIVSGSSTSGGHGPVIGDIGGGQGTGGGPVIGGGQGTGGGPTSGGPGIGNGPAQGGAGQLSDAELQNHVLSNNLPTQDQSTGQMSSVSTTQNAKEASEKRLLFSQSTTTIPFSENGTPVQPSTSPPHSPPLASSPSKGGISPTSPIAPSPPPPPPGIGVPPPPPPLGGGAPPPPPFGMNSAPSLPAKPLIKPNVKVRPFYWSKVPNNLVVSSFWGKAKDRFDELDLKMIDEQFQIEERTNAPNLGQLTKKNAQKSLLDNKRAQNLGIFLSGFKLNAQHVDRRLNFIDENEGGLPLEIVIALKRFQPSTEEAEMYKNYKGVKEDLPKTDQFMIKLCEIPGLNARLDLLLFILEFPIQYEELSPAVSTVLQSCTEITNSKKFHTVMEYILAIGNYLNGGTNRGAAHGFKIASLPKMIDTRGRERNYTLINLLVDMLSEKEAGTLSLGNDLKSVKYAVEASVKGLTAEVEVSWKGLAKIKKLNTDLQVKRKTSEEADTKFHDDVNTFVSVYEAKLVDLGSRCDKMKGNFTELLTLLGEPQGKDSEETFGNINKFLTSFTAVVQEQEKSNAQQKSPCINNNQSPTKEGQKSTKPPNKEQFNMSKIVGELKEKQVAPKPEGVKSTKQGPNKQDSLKQRSTKQDSLKRGPMKQGSMKPVKPPVKTPCKKPTRQGTLQKLSGGKHKHPKWDIRHFELDDSGHLHYFKKADGKVVNSIYLRGAPVSIDEEDRCLLNIKTEERTFCLKASTEAEAMEWKNDLTCYTG